MGGAATHHWTLTTVLFAHRMLWNFARVLIAYPMLWNMKVHFAPKADFLNPMMERAYARSSDLPSHIIHRSTMRLAST
jgi:hypothetical protein